MNQRAVIVALATIGIAGVAAGAAIAPGHGATDRSATAWQCTGSEVTLFNNTNGSLVKNGGTQPTFSTAGKPFCVTYLEHYHWNDGHGAPPTTIGLKRQSGPVDVADAVGPFTALASPGQNNVPNVNWYVYVPRTPPQVIEGTYACTDTGATTWSSNNTSGGRGFCIVKGIPAVPTTTRTATTITTTPNPVDAKYDTYVEREGWGGNAEYGVLEGVGRAGVMAATFTIVNSKAATRMSAPTAVVLKVTASPAVWAKRVAFCPEAGLRCGVPAQHPGEHRKRQMWIDLNGVDRSGSITISPRLDPDCSAEEELDCANNKIEAFTVHIRFVRKPKVKKVGSRFDLFVQQVTRGSTATVVVQKGQTGEPAAPLRIRIGNSPQAGQNAPAAALSFDVTANPGGLKDVVKVCGAPGKLRCSVPSQRVGDKSEWDIEIDTAGVTESGTITIRPRWAIPCSAQTELRCDNNVLPKPFTVKIVYRK